MTSEPCPIIAIGASAGGLEAVSQLIANIPADFAGRNSVRHAPFVGTQERFGTNPHGSFETPREWAALMRICQNSSTQIPPRSGSC